MADYLEAKVLGTSSRVTVTNVSDSAGVETLLIDLDESGIDHDALLNFVLNEHIDHSTVSVVAGGDDALAFLNNDLTSDIGLTVDIVGTTVTLDTTSDSLLLIHDFSEDSAGVLRSITKSDFLGDSGTTDELIKVSADDSEAGFLEDKLVAGDNITLVTLTDSVGFETLQVNASDELVKVSSDDALAEYLEDKILGTTDHITVTTVTDSSGVETLVLDIGAHVFDKVDDTTDDIIEGVVNLFYTDERVDDRVADLLVGGTSITIIYDDSAGSLTINNDFPEQVRVSATDTIPSYLEDALVGGSFITLTTLTDSSGDETISIDFDGINLEDVLDVTYDSAAPQTGDLLQYNGSEWNNTPPEDIPETQTWSFNGGHSQVGNNFTRGMSWGHQQAENGIVMLRDGLILGFSGSLTQPRASGTCEFQLTINGIAQNGVGETFLIDGTNTISNSLEFTTPLSVVVGDIVSAQTVTVGFSPTSSDPTVAFWGRDS